MIPPTQSRRRAMPARYVPARYALALMSVPLLAGLAACSSSPSSGGGSPSPSSASPSSSPSATLAGAPLSVTCEQLIPAGQISAVVPGATPIANFQPEADSSATLAASINGIACGLDVSGATIAIGVAQPTADSLQSLESRFSASGTPDSSFGSDVTAYFDQSTGEEDVFTPNSTWLSVQSSAYQSASDASTLLQYLLQALPSG